MGFKVPVVVYTAATNLEAHSVVGMLIASGIDAHAVEDQSGVSLWEFGIISQFHQPNVFVDQPDVQRAAELIANFEVLRKQRNAARFDRGEASAVCDACGEASAFPAVLCGTTQVCPRCRAYVDVGDDFTESENDFIPSEDE